jgi:hypothetical protein
MRTQLCASLSITAAGPGVHHPTPLKLEDTTEIYLCYSYDTISIAWGSGKEMPLSGLELLLR